jgi:hypothetical protein
MNSYEQKIEAKRQRMLDRASKLQTAAAGKLQSAHSVFDNIPFGQPILVGHHSEHADRKRRARAHAAQGKSYELSDQAGELLRRAETVGEHGISSDDPDAIAKLREKLATEEALQARVKADKNLRFGKGCDALKNITIRVRATKKRIAELEKKAAAPVREPVTFAGGRIYESRELNRICVETEARDPVLAAKLKEHGFRWAPSVGAWVRQSSNQAWYWAKESTGAT